MAPTCHIKANLTIFSVFNQEVAHSLYYHINGFHMTIGLLSLIIISVNITSLILMIKRGERKNTIHIVVTNVSLADLIVGIGTLTVVILDVFCVTKDWICRITFSLLTATFIISVTSMAVAIVDKYVSLNSPVPSLTMNSQNLTLITCVAIWFLSILMTVISTFHYKTDQYLNGCYIMQNVPDWYLHVLVSIFCIHVTTVLFCYCNITKALRNFQIIRKNISDYLNEVEPGGENENNGTLEHLPMREIGNCLNKKTLNTFEPRSYSTRKWFQSIKETEAFICILLLNCIIWTPFFVCVFIYVFCPHHCNMSNYLIFPSLLALSGSWFKTLVYMLKIYRKRTCCRNK